MLALSREGKERKAMIAADARVLTPGPNATHRTGCRVREIARSISRELGGVKRMPLWRRELVRSAACAAIHIEVMQQKLEQGDDIDHHIFQKSFRIYADALNSLGLSPQHHKIRNPGSDDAYDAEGNDPDTITRTIVRTNEPVPERI
jgi:hypothetical protein